MNTVVNAGGLFRRWLRHALYRPVCLGAPLIIAMLTAGASSSSLRDMQIEMMALLSEIKAEMTTSKKLLTKCEAVMTEVKTRLDQLAAEEVTQTLELKYDDEIKIEPMKD